MSTVVWRIHDQKPGHANQTRGLVEALATMTNIECFDVAAPTGRRCWLWCLQSKFPPGQQLPRPDIIVGAGHGTHWAVLAARRAAGGRAIILMKPSLPARLFDLCIVPEHDSVRLGKNVIHTRGVLNAIAPCASHQRERGLILIGGPSANSGWNHDAIISQIIVSALQQASVEWTLTTSRRTPPDFTQLLSAECPENLTIVPHEQTGPGWVGHALARAAQVWVSEESVSMVYEALTSGAAVGLFAVPDNRAGRVARGMAELVRTGWVTRFDDWDRQGPLPSPPEQLHEARRCAELICARYQLPRFKASESRLAG